MCGISALLLADQKAKASPEICEALGILQHRGQDAAGIVTCGNKGRLYQCKGNGMVRDVFAAKDRLNDLAGCMGIGHGTLSPTTILFVLNAADDRLAAVTSSSLPNCRYFLQLRSPAVLR
jgi:glutamine phosphoribosylpyrophosphate amidotransferase